MSHRFASKTVSLNSPISTFSLCDWHPADPTHWNAWCVSSMPLRTSIDQRMSMWYNSKWRTLPAPVFFTVDLLMGEGLWDQETPVLNTEQWPVREAGLLSIRSLESHSWSWLWTSQLWTSAPVMIQWSCPCHTPVASYTCEASWLQT